MRAHALARLSYTLAYAHGFKKSRKSIKKSAHMQMHVHFIDELLRKITTFLRIIKYYRDYSAILWGSHPSL